MKSLILVGIIVCLFCSLSSQTQLSGDQFWEELCPVTRASVKTMALPCHPYRTNDQVRDAFREIAIVYPNSRISAVSDTGSMEPVLQFGDLLICDRCPFEDLKKGDIIVFTSTDFREFDALSHRIVKIDSDGIAHTRGDASKSRRYDKTPTTPENFVARVVAKVSPRSGRVVWFVDREVSQSENQVSK